MTLWGAMMMFSSALGKLSVIHHLVSQTCLTVSWLLTGAAVLRAFDRLPAHPPTPVVLLNLAQMNFSVSFLDPLMNFSWTAVRGCVWGRHDVLSTDLPLWLLSSLIRRVDHTSESLWPIKLSQNGHSSISLLPVRKRALFPSPWAWEWFSSQLPQHV